MRFPLCVVVLWEPSDPTYPSLSVSGTLSVTASLLALLTTVAEVNTDSEGLSAEHLAHVLDNWETEKPGVRRPKLLYTIPMGSNPTGYSIPEYRKKEM